MCPVLHEKLRRGSSPAALALEKIALLKIKTLKESFVTSIGYVSIVVGSRERGDS